MRLAEEHKHFVVTRFARFIPLRQIVKDFIAKYEDEFRHVFTEAHETYYDKYEQRDRLTAAFRRLNITHSQFPQKYRDLFQETRAKFLAEYRDTSLHMPDNVIRELETLYGLTRELAFEQRDPKHITLALQILKTVAACNAVNAQAEGGALPVEEVKALTTTAKALCGEVKKESKRLAKFANPN